jgi:hypothetical protein
LPIERPESIRLPEGVDVGCEDGTLRGSLPRPFPEETGSDVLLGGVLQVAVRNVGIDFRESFHRFCQLLVGEIEHAADHCLDAKSSEVRAGWSGSRPTGRGGGPMDRTDSVGRIVKGPQVVEALANLSGYEGTDVVLWIIVGSVGRV